jgi:hypothetical protein
MFKLMALALPVLLSSACVFRSHTVSDDCSDCWEDSGNPPDAPPQPEYTLVLDPATLAPGDNVLATLTARGEFDVETVEAVTVLGPAVVLDTLPRVGEVIVALEADADAARGTYHLLLDLRGGETILFEDALTIVDAGSP